MICHIIDNIFIGDKFGASDKYYLANLNIERVINLAGFKFDNLFENIEYLNFRIKDRENDILPIDDCIQFIEKNNKNILIHCAGAHSRSPSIISAYLIHHYKYNLNQAITLIIQKRGEIKINDGFMHQLKNFEKMNK